MNWGTDPKGSWARSIGLWVMAMALGVFLLTACIPKGAKNWPFSIGPQTNSVAGPEAGGSDFDHRALEPVARLDAGPQRHPE
ncbi:MAG: hypothetical protein P8Z00_13985 [Anaerolineales bacterium]